MSFIADMEIFFAEEKSMFLLSYSVYFHRRIVGKTYLFRGCLSMSALDMDAEERFFRDCCYLCEMSLLGRCSAKVRLVLCVVIVARCLASLLMLYPCCIHKR